MNLFSAPMRAEMKRSSPLWRWFLPLIFGISILAIAESYIDYHMILRYFPWLWGNMLAYYIYSFLNGFLPSHLCIMWLVWSLVLREFHEYHLHGDFLKGLDSTNLFKLRYFVQAFDLSLVVCIVDLSTLPVYISRLYQSTQAYTFSFLHLVVLLISVVSQAAFWGCGALLLGYFLSLRFPGILTNRAFFIPLTAMMALPGPVIAVLDTKIVMPLSSLSTLAQQPNMLLIFRTLFIALFSLMMLAAILWFAYGYVARNFKALFHEEDEFDCDVEDDILQDQT
jgi:hypothetical protein